MSRFRATAELKAAREVEKLFLGSRDSLQDRLDALTTLLEGFKRPTEPKKAKAAAQRSAERKSH